MAKAIPIPTPQPTTSGNGDETDIDCKVINHVSNMAAIFEKILTKSMRPVRLQIIEYEGQRKIVQHRILSKWAHFDILIWRAR